MPFLAYSSKQTVNVYTYGYFLFLAILTYFDRIALEGFDNDTAEVNMAKSFNICVDEVGYYMKERSFSTAVCPVKDIYAWTQT